MLIHNGDHAQFEIDNANVPKEERADWPLPSFDAQDWAKAFNQRFPSVAIDDALGWFANALMRGFDEAQSRSGAKLTRRQAAIVGAFTGIACGPFEDIHEYVDGLPGFSGIGTISFAQKAVWDQIKRACREDFLALCPDRTEPK